MVKYSEGKIYKIESHVGDMVYYGSTTKKRLCDRMTFHRSGYNRWLKGKCNMVMAFKLFKQYGIENCKIVLIENCPCESKDELTSREAYFIRNFDCVNKHIPGRTHKEYYEDNKDKMLKYGKEYREVNKDKILDKAKEYREDNKDKIKQYYKYNKNKILEQVKEYYEDNKNKILEQKKQYYEDNKNKILEKYTCECGSVCCMGAKAKHERTKKHLNFINSQ